MLTVALLRQLTAVNMRAAATGVGIIIADVNAAVVVVVAVAVAVVVFVAAKVCVQRRVAKCKITKQSTQSQSMLMITTNERHAANGKQ